LIKGDVRSAGIAFHFGRNKNRIEDKGESFFWAFAYNTGLMPVAAAALIPIFEAKM